MKTTLCPKALFVQNYNVSVLVRFSPNMKIVKRNYLLPHSRFFYHLLLYFYWFADLCLVHTADTDKTRLSCLVLSVSAV